MARKGSHKVKTGCYTCKKRKVKCDEEKPHCARCIKTGRKCDGYGPPPVGSYSWSELLGKQPIVPAITARRNSKDGRALEFYHQVVAPAFSRFPGDDFWTRLVAQATLQEPAVHHAVCAISSFYELIDGTPIDAFVATPKGRYAIVHYNQALQHLTRVRDESVVLFVCILFVCIEALRENKQGAITHCQYGVKVFNDSEGGGSAWAREYFRPIFIRLTCCPFFFGASIEYSPAPIGFETEDISGPHATWDLCRYRINLLTTRSIRFVREYEVPTPNHPPKPEPDLSRFGERQSRLVSQLDEWLRNYDDLYAQDPPPTDNLSPYLMIAMMCLVLRVWVLACAAESEMVYDEYVETFREIVDLARQCAVVEKKKMETNRAPLHKSKFVLDMGFVPTLYFVIIKCRDLELRQAALDCMTVLAPERENLWNTALLYSVAKRIIELEHGQPSETQADGNGPVSWPKRRVSGSGTLPVKSAAEMKAMTTSLAQLPGAPPSDMRVRDALVLRDPEERLRGVGFEPIPHRPHRGVKFVTGKKADPVVLEEVISLIQAEEPGTGTSSSPDMEAASETPSSDVQTPLTPPEQMLANLKKFQEADLAMGIHPPRETGFEIS